jgi:hypothetical protein
MNYAVAEVKQGGGQPPPQMSFQEIVALGDVLSKSNFFSDARLASQAVVKILAGRELGFQPIASMVGIHIIEGKPSIGAHLMASMVKRSGKYDYRVIKCERDGCELEWLERRSDKWEVLGRTAMTLQEAIDTGLAMKSGGKEWKTNWFRSSDDMLFARCISKGYRRYCPDLTGGVAVYDPDELEPEPPPVRDDVAPTQESAPTRPEQLPAPQENPDPNPPTPEAQPGAETLTEAEVEGLRRLFVKHNRKKPDVELILTACQVPVLTSLPRSKLDYAKLVLAEGSAPPEQVERITSLVTSLGVKWGDVGQRLVDKYGVSSIGHLPCSWADEVEAKFAEALKVKEAKVNPAA